ncbi:hypothetical protein MMC28_009908, partial [Mycoblastus sanguinarius]|nr:hypothetical protein [Mycoblastus sanguinarius]
MHICSYPAAVLLSALPVPSLATSLPPPASPLAANISALSSNVGPYCTSASTWTGGLSLPAVFFKDCIKANNLLFDIEVFTHENANYEFLNAQTSASYRLPLMRTPRRYTFGMCTIAIVNINDIPAGYLPQVPAQTFPQTEVSSYTLIYETLIEVRAACLRGLNRLGWAAT